MIQYTIRRILAAIPVIIGVLIVTDVVQSRYQRKLQGRARAQH